MKSHWEKDNVELTPTSNVEIISDGCKHKLIIKEPLCADSGRYTCVSRNARTSCNLIIESSVVIVEELPESVIVNSGKILFLLIHPFVYNYSYFVLLENMIKCFVG